MVAFGAHLALTLWLANVSNSSLGGQVDIRQAGDGVGVFAAKDVRKGEVLPLIGSRASAIGVDTALASPDVGPIVAELLYESSHRVHDCVIVAMFLIIERLKGDSSFWAPYIRSLPARVPYSLHYDSELLKALGISLAAVLWRLNNVWS